MLERDLKTIMQNYKKNYDILTGVSAGFINTVFMSIYIKTCYLRHWKLMDNIDYIVYL